MQKNVRKKMRRRRTQKILGKKIKYRSLIIYAFLRPTLTQKSVNIVPHHKALFQFYTTLVTADKKGQCKARFQYF